MSLVIVNVIAHANEPAQPHAGLLTLYTRALEHDPELQAAAAARQAGREALPQARSGLLPSISFSAEHARFERRNSSVGSARLAQDSHYSRQALQATLAQPIVDLQAWHQYLAGTHQFQQANAQYHNSVQALGERLIESYFRVLRAQSKLATRQAEQEAVHRQQNQVQQQLQAGIASRIDVLEVMAESSRLAVTTVRAKSELRQSIRALERITGESVSSVLPLQQIPTQLELGTITALSARARSNNPRLLLARYQTRTSEQNARAASAAHLPTLSLEINTQRSISGADATAPGADHLRTDTTGVALRLEMPIFSGGRTSSRDREATHLLDQSRQRYRQVRGEVLSELTSTVETLNAQRKAIDAATHALFAQEAALQAAEKGRGAGVRDLVDILRARREQFAAVDVLNDAKYEYITTLARLYRLTGDLSHKSIRKLNDWLATQ